jgi:hypothetical protein
VLFHDSVRERVSRIYGPDKAYTHTVKRYMDALRADPTWQVHRPALRRRADHGSPRRETPRDGGRPGALGGHQLSSTRCATASAWPTTGASATHWAIPLATVELGFDGAVWELGAGDADLYVRVGGGDVMWQKERLLNLVLPRLPAACTLVAWLDCDLLLPDPDWPGATWRRTSRQHRWCKPIHACATLSRDAAGGLARTRD